jgi:hypothetical protein
MKAARVAHNLEYLMGALDADGINCSEVQGDIEGTRLPFKVKLDCYADVGEIVAVNLRSCSYIYGFRTDECGCTPIDCAALGRQCGSDGCGGSCGSCGTGEFCNSTWQCESGVAPPHAPSCGDGNIDLGENCDGSNLGAKTCVSLGFTGGTLDCYPVSHAQACNFDTSSCTSSVTQCSDGTPVNTCKPGSPPKFCNSAGTLVDDCRGPDGNHGTSDDCGCPSGQVCQPTGACSYCGNGACDHGESFSTCPADCPVVNLRRFHRPTPNFDHLYTTNPNEKPSGYNEEGSQGRIYTHQAPGTVPLYRLYNSVLTDSFYTTDTVERSTAISTLGYSDQGITGYVYSSQQPGTVPLYRLFIRHPEWDHFYTTSLTEKNEVLSYYSGSVTDEGIACYIYTLT